MEPNAENTSLSDLVAELQSLRVRTAYVEQEIARRTSRKELYNHISSISQSIVGLGVNSYHSSNIQRIDDQRIHSHDEASFQTTPDQGIYSNGLPEYQTFGDAEMFNYGSSINPYLSYEQNQVDKGQTTLMKEETKDKGPYHVATSKSATLYDTEGAPASVKDIIKGLITKGNQQTIEKNQIEYSHGETHCRFPINNSWESLHKTSREQISSGRKENLRVSKHMETTEPKRIKKESLRNNVPKSPNESMKMVGASNTPLNNDGCDEQDSLTKDLVAAAGNGKYDDVQCHLKKGVDIDGSARWAGLQCSALTAAAWFGHVNIVNLLLDSGAAVDKLDRHGWSALTLSAYRGHESIVRLLLYKGATLDRQDRWGRSALAAASGWGRENIVQLLLNEGASVDLQDHHGNTALISAAKWGKENICRLLLEKDASTDITNKEGHSALTETRRECHDGIMKIFNEIPAIPHLQSICNSIIVSCIKKEDLQYLNLPKKIIKNLENKAMPTFKDVSWSLGNAVNF